MEELIEKNKRDMELINLQLKLILNEITLMKAEKTYNPITETSSFLTMQNLYINIYCRRCKEKKKVINTAIHKKYTICSDCQIELMEEYTDSDNDVK